MRRKIILGYQIYDFLVYIVRQAIIIIVLQNIERLKWVYGHA